MLSSESMSPRSGVQPLSYTTRRRTFLFLVFVFLVSLPFPFLYATGYRYDWKQPTNIVSTGGMYIAIDRADTEIFVDNEPVRESRTFRRAFYVQSLDVGTHRVHVQKEGHHTWVKELPVSRHLVTEAGAFNLPLVPQVRVISEWQSATGTMIVHEPIVSASTTNAVLATTTKQTRVFTVNPEYASLMTHFSTTSTSTKKESTAEQIRELMRRNATSTPTETLATTTIESSGVRLYEKGDDIYAAWVGSFSQMPYYYCAPDFPRYSTTTPSSTPETDDSLELPIEETVVTPEGEYVMHPVQTVPTDTACDPTIRMDRRGRPVHAFAFLPGSIDLVVLAQDDGIFMVEIDDRAWQNIQPLMLGDNLKMYIENGAVYVYDGTIIYQIMYELE